MTNFTQLTARLKKLFNGLVVGFGLKRKRATVCVKSEVILRRIQEKKGKVRILNLVGNIVGISKF